MKAVIFDMDGVIANSGRYWDELKDEFIHVKAISSGQIPAAETTGLNVHDHYQYLANRFEIRVSETEFIDLFNVAAEELYTNKVALMDDFKALLAELRTNGQQIGLASSSDWIQFVMDRFEIQDAFDEIVSAEQISGEGKPAPDIYFHIASSLGVEPMKCVAVEDSSHGVQAAKAANMYCIGFRGSEDEQQDLSTADTIAESSDELRRHFLSSSS